MTCASCCIITANRIGTGMSVLRLEQTIPFHTQVPFYDAIVASAFRRDSVEASASGRYADCVPSPSPSSSSSSKRKRNRCQPIEPFDFVRHLVCFPRARRFRPSVIFISSVINRSYLTDRSFPRQWRRYGAKKPIRSRIHHRDVINALTRTAVKDNEMHSQSFVHGVFPEFGVHPLRKPSVCHRPPSTLSLSV